MLVSVRSPALFIDLLEINKNDSSYLSVRKFEKQRYVNHKFTNVRCCEQQNKLRGRRIHIYILSFVCIHVGFVAASERASEVAKRVSNLNTPTFLCFNWR
jgi:hypothetical protein